MSSSCRHAPTFVINSTCSHASTLRSISSSSLASLSFLCVSPPLISLCDTCCRSSTGFAHAQRDAYGATFHHALELVPMLAHLLLYHPHSCSIAVSACMLAPGLKHTHATAGLRGSTAGSRGSHSRSCGNTGSISDGARVAVVIASKIVAGTGPFDAQWPIKGSWEMRAAGHVQLARNSCT